jgi:hypothetical protein
VINVVPRPHVDPAPARDAHRGPVQPFRHADGAARPGTRRRTAGHRRGRGELLLEQPMAVPGRAAARRRGAGLAPVPRPALVLRPALPPVPGHAGRGPRALPAPGLRGGNQHRGAAPRRMAALRVRGGAGGDPDGRAGGGHLPLPGPQPPRLGRRPLLPQRPVRTRGAAGAARRPRPARGRAAAAAGPCSGRCSTGAASPSPASRSAPNPYGWCRPANRDRRADKGGWARPATRCPRPPLRRPCRPTTHDLDGPTVPPCGGADGSPATRLMPIFAPQGRSSAWTRASRPRHKGTARRRRAGIPCTSAAGDPRRPIHIPPARLPGLGRPGRHGRISKTVRWRPAGYKACPQRLRCAFPARREACRLARPSPARSASCTGVWFATEPGYPQSATGRPESRAGSRRSPSGVGGATGAAAGAGASARLMK